MSLEPATNMAAVTFGESRLGSVLGRAICTPSILTMHEWCVTVTLVGGHQRHIMGGLLRFAPHVGAFLAAGLPIVLAAAIDSGWAMVGWTAALFVVVEGLTGQALEPLLYGRST